MASPIGTLTFKWNPKDLEIRTYSVEKTLEPLVQQVTTLVNTKGASRKKKGKSKRAHVLVAAVDKATQKFIEKGEEIANENPGVQREMLAAVDEVRKTGENMRVASSDFADDPCSSAKRATMVRAARALLSAVTRLLILADMVDVQLLLRSLRIVKEDLRGIKDARTEHELDSRYKAYRQDANVLNKMTGGRQADLKDAGHREQLAAARADLQKHGTMLLTSSKAYIHHPEVAAARENKDYVVKQLSDAVNKISDVAQATGKSKPDPTISSPGELAAALEELDREVLMSPGDYKERRTRPSLEEKLEGIISAAALMADSSCTRDDTRERIIQECNNVRQALQDLLSEYLACAGRKERSDPLDRAIERMFNKTRDLRRQLRKAVVDHISDSFLETNLPLLVLIEAAKSGNEKEVEEYAGVFQEHANKLVEVANLACSMSANEEGVKCVRLAAQQLENLCPQVINAARILAARPRSKAALENMDAFKDQWEKQVRLLTEAVDEITTLDDFLAVSEKHILEDIGKCNEALRDSDGDKLDRCAGAIRGRSARVCHVVEAEMQNYVPNPYTDRVINAVDSLRERVMPKFAQEVEDAVEALTIRPRKPLDEEEFMDAAQMVYSGVRDIRRAVLVIGYISLLYFPSNVDDRDDDLPSDIDELYDTNAPTFISKLEHYYGKQAELKLIEDEDEDVPPPRPPAPLMHPLQHKTERIVVAMPPVHTKERKVTKAERNQLQQHLKQMRENFYKTEQAKQSTSPLPPSPAKSKSPPPPPPARWSKPTSPTSTISHVDTDSDKDLPPTSPPPPPPPSSPPPLPPAPLPSTVYGEQLATKDYSRRSATLLSSKPKPPAGSSTYSTTRTIDVNKYSTLPMVSVIFPKDFTGEGPKVELDEIVKKTTSSSVAAGAFPSSYGQSKFDESDSVQDHLLDEYGSDLRRAAVARYGVSGPGGQGSREEELGRYLYGPDGRPILGPDGRPILIAPDGTLIDSNGNPINVDNNGYLVGADGRPIIGPDGNPLMVDPDGRLMTSDGYALTGPDNKPVTIGEDGKLYGSDGRPLISITPDGRLVGADGRALPIGPGGALVGAFGRPIMTSDGKPLTIAPNGRLLDADGRPISIDANGMLIGSDGRPILGLDGKPMYLDREGRLLGADGQPIIGMDGRPIVISPDGKLLGADGRPVVGWQKYDPLLAPGGWNIVTEPDWEQAAADEQRSREARMMRQDPNVQTREVIIVIHHWKSLAQFTEEEREQIAQQVEEFELEKERLEQQVIYQWDDSGNDIIILAKNMCMIMMEMTDFTRGRGPLKTTMDVIHAARRIADQGSKLDKLARQIAELCPHSQSKDDLVAYLQRIALYCHQLNICSKVKAGVQSVSGELVVSALDSATSLIQAAKNLMAAVVQTVKASYVASTKYARQKGQAKSPVVMWKMKAPDKKPLVKREHPDELRAKVRKASKQKDINPVQELSEFKGSDSFTSV
uniref:Catenin alpha-2-like n=1 Tax=Saccoglossus kowalevskii TaxID=10224 RepID=A0ABM0M6D1_SACKO|nr:PREDICTED: catenin alpha-2-like [Saccoglossus kowalevskii]